MMVRSQEGNEARRRFWLVALLMMMAPLRVEAAPEVAPTLDYGPLGTNSVAYCPTLLLAWSELKGIVGGPVRMVDPAPLLAVLNDGRCPSNTVPEDAHVSMAGYLDDGFVQRLENALRARFGTNAPALPPDFMEPDAVFVAYSHLQRALPFPLQFIRSTKTPLRFQHAGGMTPVQCFGASAAAADLYHRQASILHYDGADDFSIQLSSRIEGESIVLAKIPAPRTLREGSEQVRRLVERERGSSTVIERNGRTFHFSNTLSEGDVLAIPHVTLDVTADFDALCNRTLQNDGFTQVFLFRVRQCTSFFMDESGAIVRSNGYGGAAFGEPTPRRFVFDKPFLLTLWKKGATEPYLALWVASPDVLVPFETRVGQ